MKKHYTSLPKITTLFCSVIPFEAYLLRVLSSEVSPWDGTLVLAVSYQFKSKLGNSWENYTYQNSKAPEYQRLYVIPLRSVADSNRRKRFCRPLPNHSVNRPCNPKPARAKDHHVIRIAKVIKFYK